MMTRPSLVCSSLMLGLALTVSACGAAGSGTGVSGAGGSQDPDAAALSWAKCMRKNGVDIPDPKPHVGDEHGNVGLAPGLGGPMPGNDAKAFSAAKAACAHYAKDMGGAAGEGFTEKDKQRMVDFARCMREHGVNMPDPDLDGRDGQVGVEIEPDDPDFEAAREACRKFSPSEVSR